MDWSINLNASMKQWRQYGNHWAKACANPVLGPVAALSASLLRTEEGVPVDEELLDYWKNFILAVNTMAQGAVNRTGRAAFRHYQKRGFFWLAAMKAREQKLLLLETGSEQSFAV